MPLTIRLCKVEKALWEKVPIALNNVLNLYRHSIFDLQHKGNLVSLQVQTAHFGIGLNEKQAGKSFGKKISQKLDRIENNPLAVIVTFLTIYRQLIHSIIDVGPITPWDMFKMLCTGMAVTEFNDILFKASGKTFEFIQAYFNENICLAYESSDEVNSWKERNYRRKLERQRYPVTAYSYRFSPSGIHPLPERASVDKLVHWTLAVIVTLLTIYR